MSEELSTIRDDITIHSMASSGKYHLSVYEKGKGKIAENSWPMDEYGGLIRTLWANYLKTGEKPKLLGQTLSDEGFVEETLHYIAPGVFSCPDGPRLDDSREYFLYWLKAEASNIGLRIGEQEFSYLNRALEAILQTHLERKSI
ncbi:MAG TPA: hypothetical protein VJ438_03575 [Candidatus Nanoarchaeia archaeon]|nr:hypothetical protein [Candidatus Nanoarchaeia archaeon]